MARAPQGLTVQAVCQLVGRSIAISDQVVECATSSHSLPSGGAESVIPRVSKTSSCRGESVMEGLRENPTFGNRPRGGPLLTRVFYTALGVLSTYPGI